MWLLKRQLDQLLELRCNFKVLEKLPEEERDSYYEMLLRTYRAIRTTGPGKAAEEGSTASFGRTGQSILGGSIRRTDAICVSV